MRPLIIICIIVFVLFLLLQIRVGGSAEYSADGFTADAVIACFRITLFPRPKLTPIERDKKAVVQAKKSNKKKQKKTKTEKNKASKNGSAKPNGKSTADNKTKDSETAGSVKQKTGGTIELILDLLPVIGKLLSGLEKKIRINRLNIELSVGGDDAAAVAIAYGRISSVGPYIVSWAEENLDLREHHIQVTPDFLSGSTAIAIQAKVTYTVGQLLRILLKAAFSALVIFLKYRKKKDKAV